MASKKEWIEGVRGLAALQVMTHHIVWSISPWLMHATTNGKVTLIQWPIIRVFYAGGFSVDEFVIIAAYVSAIRPIKQTRTGQNEDALIGIAKAAFKRIFRLLIPVVLMTTTAWILCQMGAFSFSQAFQGSWWVRHTTPTPSANFSASLHDLFYHNFTTWYNSLNIYERNFWVMRYFLQASFYCYIILFSTVHVSPNRRFLIYAILYAYNYATFEPMTGINTCFGLALAELHQTTSFKQMIEKKPKMMKLIAAPLIGIGLFFASYPLSGAEEPQWSNILFRLGNKILPGGADRARYFTSMGAQLIFVGISLTTFVQDLLSYPWLVWLGKVSWPVYLVHGTCIRTVLLYILYGVINGQRAEGPQEVTIKEIFNIAIVLPFFYVFVYKLAHLWSLHVDPICDKLSKWIEESIFLHDQHGGKGAGYMLLSDEMQQRRVQFV